MRTFCTDLLIERVNLVGAEEDERLPQEVAAPALQHAERQVLLELDGALLGVEVARHAQ